MSTQPSSMLFWFFALPLPLLVVGMSSLLAVSSLEEALSVSERLSDADWCLESNAVTNSGLQALVIKCRTKQPWWPVPLKEHLTASLQMGSFGAGGAATPAKAAAAPKKAAAPSSSSGGGGGGGGGSGQPWLHPKMSNPDASAMLQGNSDGYFMIRVHNADSSQYVVSVVFRGKPTHHLCVAPDGAVSTVNKKPTGARGTTTPTLPFALSFPASARCRPMCRS